MTHDGRLKTSISSRHFGQEIEPIRVEDLKFARQRRGLCGRLVLFIGAVLCSRCSRRSCR